MRELFIQKALNRKIKVNDVIGMEKPMNYRNKLQFPVGEDAKQHGYGEYLRKNP